MDKLSQHIAQIRTDYTLATLDEANVGTCPITFFKQWFTEAEQAEVTEVNAISLATVGKDMQPHVRTVLLKGIENDHFVFYSNYNSNKGQEIAANSKVAILFFWKELQRQVRIEGVASLVDAAISDAYFDIRPDDSKIGAIASPQSTIIQNRAVLEQRVQEVAQQFMEGQQIPRPSYWGGYQIDAHKIEFWQGRASRLHDRIVFEKIDNNNWKKYRIAP